MTIDVNNKIQEITDELDHNFDPDSRTYRLRVVRRAAETALMKAAYEFFDQNQSKTALWLGLNRATFKKRMNTYGIEL